MQKIADYWSKIDFSLALGIFFAYFVIDALYAYYTFSVIKKKPFSAATTGFVMHFLLAFGVINYVNNFLYVLPLALGAWFGTYLVVWMEKRKENNLQKLRN